MKTIFAKEQETAETNQRLKTKIKEKIKRIISVGKLDNGFAPNSERLVKPQDKTSIRFLRNVYLDFINQETRPKGEASTLNVMHSNPNKSIEVYQCPTSPATIYPRAISARRHTASIRREPQRINSTKVQEKEPKKLPKKPSRSTFSAGFYNNSNGVSPEVQKISISHLLKKQSSSAAKSARVRGNAFMEDLQPW